ncbi:glycosyltransferase [Microbacterium sp. W4I20]|uniref:glycosyltransferase n=1 Tax=Microbacterium sp. W4I20 TaxID=3042262 RepID=UPI002788441C|nr:glycosyltransferase [Microbacterium sp. W4I20]MDQ0725926.1 glycosyltransferase involved in cell wall biosynthesis [Microbacterium sp. W4I20]
MRILFITPWYPTVSQPVAGVFVERDARLMSADHEVEVAHLVDPALLGDEDAGADARSDLRVHRIPMGRIDPLAPLRAWRKLRPLIEGADLVHSHAFQALLPFAWRPVRRPWVHSEHWSGVAHPESFTAQHRLVFALTSRLLRRPDMVTAVSTYLLDRVRDHRDGPTMIVPSVVPAVQPTPVQHSADALRLVTVANLVEGKDPMLAVDTVDELRRRGVPASLRWAGDGPLRATVQERIDDRGSAVTLLGALDRAGVAAELDAGEIFLLPTRSETLCLSAIEAISHGRPVVIGARGGQRDYITADNGVLVTDRTPQAYADAVLGVAAEFSRHDPEGVAATVRGRFTPDRVRELYQSAYTAAIAHAERP